jgi:hypothetical protein
LTKKIAAQFNISVPDDSRKFNLPTGKSIKFNTIEDGLKIAQNAQFVKTKLIVDDNNAQTIAEKFFGYSSKKTNVTTTSQEGKSKNVYNELGALSIDAGAFLNVAENVLQQIYKQQGQQGGNVQSDPQKYNTAINQMKIISNLYAKWINIINHDMQTMMKINNDVVVAARNEMQSGDAQDSINKYGAEYNAMLKNGADLSKIKAKLEATKQKNPNDVSLTYRIKAIDALLANPNAFDEYLAQQQGQGQQPKAAAPVNPNPPAVAQNVQEPEAAGTTNQGTNPQAVDANATNGATSTPQDLTKLTQEDATKIEQMVKSGDPSELIKWYYQLLDKVNGR